MPATKVLQKEKEELASKLKEREEKCDKLAKDLEEMEEKKNYWVRQFRERGRTMESLKDELEQLHATDTHTEIQDTAGELREHKSMVKLLLPMAKRQIKERFMLEVCGAELEREKEEGGHKSLRLAFLATSKFLLQAVEALRKQGLDVDEQRIIDMYS